MKTLLRRDIEVSTAHITYKSIFQYFNYDFEIEESYVRCYSGDNCYYLYKTNRGNLDCFKPVENKFLLNYELFIDLASNIETDIIKATLAEIDNVKEYTIQKEISKDLIKSIAYYMYEISDSHTVFNKLPGIEKSQLSKYLYQKDEDTLCLPLFKQSDIVNILDFTAREITPRYQAGGRQHIKKEEAGRLIIFTHPYDFIKLQAEGKIKNAECYFLSSSPSSTELNEITSFYASEKYQDITVVINQQRESLLLVIRIIERLINSFTDIKMACNVMIERVDLNLTYNREVVKNLTITKFYNSLTNTLREDLKIKPDIDDAYMPLSDLDFMGKPFSINENIRSYEIGFSLKVFHVRALFNQIRKLLREDKLKMIEVDTI